MMEHINDIFNFKLAAAKSRTGLVSMQVFTR